MSKTALQIVNSVLVRLREDTVSNFSAAYTQLILEFVNETMREVQDRHQWDILRKEIQFSTVASQQRYILTGDTNSTYGDVTADTDVINQDSSIVFTLDEYTGQQVPAAWGFSGDSITEGQAYRLRYYGKERGASLRYMEQTASIAMPERFYTYSSRESDGTDTKSFYFIDIPSTAIRVVSTWYVPSEALTATTDVVQIPDLPIVLGAWAKALDERGEELGPQVGNAMQKYQTALDNAVMQDQGDDTYISVPE